MFMIFTGYMSRLMIGLTYYCIMKMVGFQMILCGVFMLLIFLFDVRISHLVLFMLRLFLVVDLRL